MPSALTCSSGSRVRWSAWNRRNRGSTRRWPARTTGEGLQQQHAPSRLEDPDPLGNGPTVVGDRAEAETEQDGIAPVTGELEGLGVGLSQVHVPAQLVGAPSSLGQHG